MNTKLPIILSLVAIVISVVAVCLVLFRVEPITVDSLSSFGWTTAALSIIVMLLIGWNIYSLIDLNKHKREVIDLSNSMEERITKTQDMIRTKLSLESMGLTSHLFSIKTDTLNESILNSFREFSSYIAEDSFILKGLTREHILKSLSELSKHEEASLRLIDSISTKLKHEQVEAFYHEFASYSPQEKQKYSGVQSLLLRLLEATHRNGVQS